MKLYFIFIAAALLAIGSPQFEKQGLSYQENLWTSEWAKDAYPNPGFVFCIGKIAGVQEWSRIRLGLPFKATTIDSQISAGVLQGRVETSPLLLNLLFLVVASIPALLILLYLRIILKLSREKP